MFHNWRDFLTRQESQKIQNSDLECVFNTLFITSTWAWKVISGLIFSPAGSKKDLRALEYLSYTCWVILCMQYACRENQMYRKRKKTVFLYGHMIWTISYGLYDAVILYGSYDFVIRYGLYDIIWSYNMDKYSIRI